MIVNLISAVAGAFFGVIATVVAYKTGLLK